MRKAQPPDPADRLAQQPAQVEISVLGHSHDGRLRLRVRGIPFRRHRGIIAVLALSAGATAAVVSDVLLTGTGTRAGQRTVNTRARERGALGVAAADGPPLRCLSITFAPLDPAWARADFNEAAACGRFAGYATAIFHRVDGTWRPALYTLHFPCPAPGVPRAIQAQLAVCPEFVPSRPDARAGSIR